MSKRKKKETQEVKEEVIEQIDFPRYDYMEGLNYLDGQGLYDIFKRKFDTAYANYDIDKYDKWESLYLGSARVDANRNNVNSQRSKKKAINVYNINYELVESQVDTTTYQPKVKAKHRGFGSQAKMIQEKIANDIQNAMMEEMNDLQERNTYIHGLSATMIDWDNTIHGMDYMGDKDIRLFHAKQIIPQPNIYDIDKMDYFFTAVSTTKKSINSRYGIVVSTDGEEHPEFNQLVTDEGDLDERESSNPDNELVTEITCYYKDDDGDIGKLIFTYNELILNMPKYYYPRANKCKECGEEFTQMTNICPKCNSKEVKTDIITHEEAEEDIVLDPISYPEYKKVVKTREVPKLDENDQPMTNELGKVETETEKYIEEVREEVIIERKIKKGDKIPVFAIKEFPLVIRRNVTKNFDFAGTSDVDIIKDQANEIKKSMHKASKKVNQTSSLLFLPEGLKNKQITTDEYQVWYCTMKEMQSIKFENIQANATQNLDYVNMQAEIAKATLGITASFQGQADTTAKSGRAKLAQIQQAEGRLASKRANKRSYYINLFRKMFYFDLAFTEEPREYLANDNKGEDSYGVFDKKQLLMLNKEDEWEYVIDFKFEADLDDSLPTDKQSMYEYAIQQYQMQAFDLEAYWQQMESIGFPNAGKQLDQIKEQKKAEQALIEKEQNEQLIQGEQQSPQNDTANTMAMLPPEIAQQAMQDPAVLAQMNGGV